MAPESIERNAILGYLSAEDLDLLRPNLEPLDLPVRTWLASANRSIEMIYFLESGIASTTTNVGHQVPIEVGIVGREGVVNHFVVLGTDRSPNDTFMQIGGSGLRIEADTLRRTMERSATLTLALLRFVHTFMAQTASTVLANGRASTAERLARWLLMARDRVDADGIALTHEFLAIMLGVQRPGVSVALRDFEQRGFIERQRGLITIVDRPGLEKAANGYYGVAEREFRRLFGG